MKQSSKIPNFRLGHRSSLAPHRDLTVAVLHMPTAADNAIKAKPLHAIHFIVDAFDAQLSIPISRLCQATTIVLCALFDTGLMVEPS